MTGSGYMTAAFAAMLAAVSLPAAEVRLPEEFAVADGVSGNDDRTWRQYGEIPLAYTAARNKVDLALRRQGWRRMKTVDYDPVRWKSVELWGRGAERILVQFWRIETARTGFAWGKVDGGART